MFIHNFKYAFKTLFSNKMLIFWTFAFPIILGTFFNMAFSNIENSEKMKPVDIAIVNNHAFEFGLYKEPLEKLGSEKKEEKIFNIKYVDSKKDAKELLDKNKVSGYFIIIDDKPNVVVNKNGFDETIFKYVIEEIDNYIKITSNIGNKKIAENPNETGRVNTIYQYVYLDVTKKISEYKANIKDVSRGNLSYTMIEFYTLIAMACLYGGILGTVSINNVLANMSNNGKRVSVSPTSKAKLVLSSTLASYVVQLIGLLLLFLYTIFVLKVDYGNNLPHVILLSLAGSLAGLSLGIFVSCVFKTNENTKTGIIIAFTMLGCFLSGMMGITMKYIIDKNVPIINKINPASMITDGFYSLYYYGTSGRFFFNVVSLLIFSLILIGISVLSLRRRTYDSI